MINHPVEYMADLEHGIQIAAARESIFPLFATGKGFAQWWAADITESDGAVSLGFFQRSTVYRVKLVREKAPLEADWLCESGYEWSGTHLIFRLEPGASGTLLRFSHAGWQSATPYFINCNTTWGELMYRLKAAAEGKTPGPLFLPESLAY
jgi:uncharacterized protein YndB with AHSA1/START domain